MFLGLLKVDYAVAFMTLSAIGGAVGNVVVYALVKAYNKTWFVVALLCFVVGISTILLVRLLLSPLLPVVLYSPLPSRLAIPHANACPAYLSLGFHFEADGA
jgi:hypothetical protein